MKKRNTQIWTKLILVITVLLSFASCDNVSEEITLEKDGSGEYVVYTDMVTSMVKMAEQMMELMAEMDSTASQKDVDPEGFRQATLDKIWEDFPDEVDSTQSLVKMVPDSLLDTPEKRAIAERGIYFMKGTRKEGVMHSGMRYSFKDDTNLNAFLTLLNEASENEGGNAPSVGIDDTNYSYAKKRFSRKSTVAAPEEMSEEDKEMMEQMFGDAKFTTVVKTPRKIKKVIGKNIKSQEKKKVVFEYGMMEIMEDLSVTDFEIIMKGK